MSVLPATTPPLDVNSSEWRSSLRAPGRAGEVAIARLHAVLLRATRFEVARRAAGMPHLRGNELHDIALESDLDEAHYLLNKLYAAGVDYDDVVATLEREGIEKFVASVDRLLDQIRAKREALAAAA